jgi:hypothetical protein
LYAGTAGYALLLIEVETQKFSESAAVVISSCFRITKSFEHQAVADDAVLKIHCVGLFVHIHHKFSDSLGSFSLSCTTFSTDDNTFAHGYAIQQVLIPKTAINFGKQNNWMGERMSIHIKSNSKNVRR